MHSSGGALCVHYLVSVLYLCSKSTFKHRLKQIERGANYLFNFILAIPLNACETFNSHLSSDTGGKDSNNQVSAFIIRGSIKPSSSSIRDQIIEVLEAVLRVTSRSMTNWVAETITCCA